MDEGISREAGRKVFGLESLKGLQRQIFRFKERFFIFFGVVLVGVLAYQAGMLQGSTKQREPLVISLPAIVDSLTPEPQAPSAGQALSAGLERAVSQDKDLAVLTTCVLVGSRNSNKYHLPTCAPAKRIKPENRVCFASKEDAEKRGYVAGCLK